jgi:hypothetical protein
MEIDELILGIIIKEMGEMLSEAFLEFAEILNLFSSRFFSFLDSALLGFFDRTPAEPFDSR